MPGRKSGRAQGLERTDNNMDLTSWPQISMINQKNYYTEYLKRDEQLLALRLQHEAERRKMVSLDKARWEAHQKASDPENDGDIDMDEGVTEQENKASTDMEDSKIIVIHPGSQNLRIGLASDILPKSIPMVIARKTDEAECETEGGEPRPKRRKLEVETDRLFGEQFSGDFATMTADLKIRAKRAAVRTVPNAREQAIVYNRRTVPDEISEHNDVVQINWTEIPADSAAAKNHLTGHEATRIPDLSNPRYKLSWPIRHGVLNEAEYESKVQLLQDLAIIIEDAITNQLGVSKNAWDGYSCVFVIPDLYERNYVTTILEMLFRDFGFSRVTFIQESMAASFGAGYSTCVVVDVGAQKTSICCVDEGLCIENSRVLLRYGGADVTETFLKMMLLDGFPYGDINLKRRYDYILAEELKRRFCTLDPRLLQQVSKPHDFDVRAPNQRTRHYTFKTYDEVVLAPLGYIYPSIFDHSSKMIGRRELIDRSYDLYDGSPNDPMSTSQMQILQSVSQANGDIEAEIIPTTAVANTQAKRDFTPNKKAVEDTSTGAKVSEQDGRDTPQLGRATSAEGGDKEVAPDKLHPLTEMIHTAEVRDATLPVISLVEAINISIAEGAKGDERKTRDFYGGIMAVGGGSLTAHFHSFLEDELHVSQPKFKKELIVSLPPREIDPQVLAWKGASVFGKLRGTNDSWISALEYQLLNSRILSYKCLWNW